jgi:diadenylate cyclase
MFLAFLFWSTVLISQGEIHEKSFSVPIEYIATPSNVTLVGEKPTEMKLHLAGPKADLDVLNPNQLGVKIDLSKAMARKQTIFVKGDDVALPKRVNLLDAEPSSLVLSIEEILEREVIVKPQLVGKLPKRLKLVSIDINPKKVRALYSVSEKQPNEITVTTTPLYLESINETTRLFCKIIAPPSVQPLDRRWPDVEVKITVSSLQ